MPTKAELEERLNDAEHRIRRLERAAGQAEIDLAPVQKRLITNARPHRSEHSIEALKRAEAEWQRVIFENKPHEPDPRIDDYIRSRDGIGWTWEKPYVKNGQFAWCGAFAAFCWSSVRFSIRQKIFPSCYRLYSRWVNTARHIEADQMLPGDIVVVFASKRSVQGDHITICSEAPDCDGKFKTIEGNAYGTAGDGLRGEGVVKNTRSLDQVAHVYRLLSEDFDE